CGKTGNEGGLRRFCEVPAAYPNELTNQGRKARARPRPPAVAAANRYASTQAARESAGQAPFHASPCSSGLFLRPAALAGRVPNRALADLRRRALRADVVELLVDPVARVPLSVDLLE